MNSAEIAWEDGEKLGYQEGYQKGSEEGYQEGLVKQFEEKEMFMQGWNAALEHAEDHFQTSMGWAIQKAKKDTYEQAYNQGYEKGTDAGMKIK